LHLCAIKPSDPVCGHFLGTLDDDDDDDEYDDDIVGGAGGCGGGGVTKPEGVIISARTKEEQKLSSEEDRSLVLYIATSVLLKPPKQRLINITSFRLSKLLYSRSVLFKRTNNFGSLFHIHWNVECTKPNSRHTLVFFLFCISLITLTFSSTLSLVLVNVTMLSSYRSPVNCRVPK